MVAAAALLLIMIVSQTPFGFDGGLDNIEKVGFPCVHVYESQTPFGFDGGLDRFREAAKKQSKIQSQTPFGFDDGLDCQFLG